jgi:hypothetical protein
VAMRSPDHGCAATGCMKRREPMGGSPKGILRKAELPSAYPIPVSDCPTLMSTRADMDGVHEPPNPASYRELSRRSQSAEAERQHRARLGTVSALERRKRKRSEAPRVTTPSRQSVRWIRVHA